jgi:hypothetical protein
MTLYIKPARDASPHRVLRGGPGPQGFDEAARRMGVEGEGRSRGRAIDRVLIVTRRAAAFGLG